LVEAAVPIATCGGRFCSDNGIFCDGGVISGDAFFAASGGALCYKRRTALLQEVNSVATFSGDDVFLRRGFG
jgi:hypothetical protein